MARNPQRGDLVRRIARFEEELRQLRTRRPVFDLPYMFVDADFAGQTISGTYYGWAASGFSALPLRLQRYGGLVSLTGTFVRLWTADGSTPAGYSPPINQVIATPPTNVPDEFLSPASNQFRVPIHHDVNVVQADLATVYTGTMELADNFNGLLNLALAHFDGSALPQVPHRRTVYFYVDITVPYTPPPS